MFGVAMAAFALLNVLFTYHVARGSFSVAWLLCAGALAQLVAFSIFHDSAEELLAVDIATAALLLGAYAATTKRLRTPAVAGAA